MNLLIEYFRSDDYQRHSEYITCIHENLENEHIEKIYVFISDDSKLNFKSDKIEIIQKKIDQHIRIYLIFVIKI